MSGNRSNASAKNRRSVPEKTNESSSKNDVSEPRVNKKDVNPKKLTKDERDLIIAQFQLGPVTLFTIARNQEMRIQNIEDQIELYNRAVFQDLNDRLESITLEFQKLKTNKGDSTNTNKIEEADEDSS